MKILIFTLCQDLVTPIALAQPPWRSDQSPGRVYFNNGLRMPNKVLNPNAHIRNRKKMSPCVNFFLAEALGFSSGMTPVLMSTPQAGHVPTGLAFTLTSIIGLLPLLIHKPGFSKKPGLYYFDNMVKIRMIMIAILMAIAWITVSLNRCRSYISVLCGDERRLNRWYFRPA